ncbi:MAG: hypothetical protein KDA53_11930, partial [Hyphomonas sp.]|nr:hypothetical protein [Hyphomonas sp.]
LPIRIRNCAADKLMKPFAAADGAGNIIWTDPTVNERYKDPLSNAPDLTVCVSIGGILSILAKDKMWRSHAPWTVAQKYDLQPISEALLRKIFLAPSEAGLEFIDLLLANGFNVIALEPPPLKRTHPGIQEGTAPEVLLAMDSEWRAVFGAEMERRNVELVLRPADAIDSDGFLKDAYSFKGADDPHHASMEYAALVIPRCLEIAGGQTQRNLSFSA